MQHVPGANGIQPPRVIELRSPNLIASVARHCKSTGRESGWGILVHDLAGHTSSTKSAFSVLKCYCSSAVLRMSNKECQILLGPSLQRWNKEQVCECPEGSAIFESECLECFAPLERCRGGNITGSHCGQGSQVLTDWRSYLCALCVQVHKLWMMWNQKELRYVWIHISFYLFLWILMPASEQEKFKNLALE